jgi:hypothetical protein
MQTVVLLILLTLPFALLAALIMRMVVVIGRKVKPG